MPRRNKKGRRKPPFFVTFKLARKLNAEIKKKEKEMASGQLDVKVTIDPDFIEKINKEICICAAVKATNGQVIRGHRHCFCFHTIQLMNLEISHEIDAQGFITSRNRFVTREEGRILQDEAGIPSADLPEGYKGKTLFSEDLY